MGKFPEKLMGPPRVKLLLCDEPFGLRQFKLRGRDTCLADVARADGYMLLLAHRYGYRPTEANPDGKLITQMEYEEAGRNPSKLRLVFTVDPDHRPCRHGGRRTIRSLNTSPRCGYACGDRGVWPVRAIGVREFRDEASSILAAGETLVIERLGRLVDDVVSRSGIDEDELVREISPGRRLS